MKGNHRLGLVGGVPTPLKNMSPSIGMMIPNIRKNKKCSKPPTGFVEELRISSPKTCYAHCHHPYRQILGADPRKRNHTERVHPLSKLREEVGDVYDDTVVLGKHPMVDGSEILHQYWHL